ncbi:F0F1 ATP synthase subunit A [Candidatus Uhrbacteria bacterium]|nr:F0F1 ATP synthase subunit A [Candidatus Uhrbacteria bacterium]
MTIPPLAAEPIAHLGSWPITNAIINAWIAVFVFLVLGLLLRRRLQMVPRGAQNAVEAVTEFFLSTIQGVTRDHQRAQKFLPIVGTFFLFILFSNWMGLLPGTGSIGIYQKVHGMVELVPLLRPAASDLNLTLALAVLGVLGANLFGIAAIGFFRHLNKFFPFGTMVTAFRKGGIHIFIGLVEFFVGVIELISEMAKMVSLSLRLFGNIFAGEVLLTVIASLISVAVPLPFMGLEILVGAIQATVFSLLVLVYLTMATEKVH